MITQDELAGIDIFSSLTRGQQARIAGRSADIHVNSGEWVSYDGDPAYFWGVLDGEVEVLRRVAGEEHRVTTFESGESFGEIMLTLGTTSFGCVRALRKSRLARIDGGDFHTMLAESPEVAATIAATLSRRVTLIREAYTVAPTSRVTIVGTRDDLLCHDIRDFLARNHVPYEWFDPSDASDRECVAASVPGGVRHPAVAFADGTVLEDPTLREIARRLALRIEPEGGTYDVAIVGAGPAGLGAAVYAGSEGLRTIMIEREAPGGQAGTSSRIENYLGFPGGISGGDLASRALHQAERLGAEILVTRTVDRLLLDGEPRTLVLDGGTTVTARVVVLATGVTWRTLEAEGADRLVGRGVFYGAAQTEALATRGRSIFLIGGGNSAGQAAMFFSNYAASVTLLVRGDALERGMSSYLVEQLRTKTNVHVETGTTVVALAGNDRLERLTTHVAATGVRSERDADAVFVFIGADARTDWLPEAVERDARGYLLTGNELTAWKPSRTPYPLETSVPGVFAVGDVRSGSMKRVASSVGEGSTVVAYLHEYFASLEPATTR